jgi:putative endonuclease
MPLLPKIAFAIIRWKSRHGLQTDDASKPASKKSTALQVGVRGETFAYWYLRRQGYIFIARNYTPVRSKGEIDLVGFDGCTLAFVEVRTRAEANGKTALPELSITRGKHHILVRTAHYFLRERHVLDCPVRFDVLAIDNVPGRPPVVRLHKDALSPKA